MFEIILPLFIIYSSYQNQYFRSINCLAITYFSMVATALNGISMITDRTQNHILEKQIMIRMLSFYGASYLLVDLYKIISQAQRIRKDLILHHLIVFCWILYNWNTGITAFCFMNEIITTSYLIPNAYHQYVFRIGTMILIRYPVWLITSQSNYFQYTEINGIVNMMMMCLDLFWVKSYYGKLCALSKESNECDKKL